MESSWRKRATRGRRLGRRHVSRGGLVKSCGSPVAPAPWEGKCGGRVAWRRLGADDPSQEVTGPTRLARGPADRALLVAAPGWAAEHSGEDMPPKVVHPGNPARLPPWAASRVSDPASGEARPPVGAKWAIWSEPGEREQMCLKAISSSSSPPCMPGLSDRLFDPRPGSLRERVSALDEAFCGACGRRGQNRSTAPACVGPSSEGEGGGSRLGPSWRDWTGATLKRVRSAISLRVSCFCASWVSWLSCVWGSRRRRLWWFV